MPQQEEHEDEEAAPSTDAEPPATIYQALNDLKRLLSIKEYEPDGNSMELTILMHIERSLQQQVKLNRSQETLNGWLT
ncbi:BgTH12-00852 [Blumeria graminis f. sp. triticale]|uniref:BgTH12-00852 n=1 Tax=Blumeria graminis f. sp. triticale TaxID=1689686 RepID=A0A9W4DRS7_BLUGR|nr:BgTH12-00852 [Blumeria graminis f. sp. triticale]